MPADLQRHRHGAVDPLHDGTGHRRRQRRGSEGKDPGTELTQQVRGTHQVVQPAAQLVHRGRSARRVHPFERGQVVDRDHAHRRAGVHVTAVLEQPWIPRAGPPDRVVEASTEFRSVRQVHVIARPHPVGVGRRRHEV